jgi:hypothetical protein
MKYVLNYWDKGQYNYVDLTATTEAEAVKEATGIMEDEHIDAYRRNEWQVETAE